MKADTSFYDFFCKKFSPFFVLFFVIVISASAQTTSWTGTTSTNWSTATNWTNGVPAATIDAIIGDANFTGSFQPTFSVTSYCNNLVIGGAVNATLTVNKTVYASGNITVNSGSTITHTAGTISLKGSWTNNGTYNGTVSTVTVRFTATGQAINGTSITNFKKLTVSSSCIITSNVNIDVATLFTVSGTFVPAENATPVVVSGAGGLTVGSAGVLKVNAATFGGNYTLSGTRTFTNGNTIEYSATLVNQTVNETITYSTLKVSGALVKTLGGNLPALVSATSSTGRITVSSGTLDLSTFTADRGTTVAGGTLTVSNGATLRIGGTTTLPANYVTNTLGASGTVEYYGDNQIITAKTYGNLVFSGTSGTVVKTLPATAFTVAGNFTGSVGTASSLSFTAAAIITFNGNINIGASTIFYAGSFSHPAKGNWVNNGTVEGNTSTFTCSGTNKSFSGAGTYNFNNLTITGVGFSASATTNISVNGNFVTSGSGTFTHAASGTLTMSGTSKAVTGAGIVFGNLTCSGTITTASTFTIAENLSVTGSLTASAGTITLNGSSKNISGSGVISLKGLSVGGSITTTSNFTIGTSLNISGTFSAASPSTATFSGTSTLNGTANLFNVTLNGTSLQLSTSAVLGIANTFTITAGSLNVTSTTPNTVNYNGTGAQTVTATTYNNLVLSNGNTKTAGGAITVNGNMTIDAPTTFNASSFTHAITGSFTNNGAFTAGTSTINFTGASDGAINGATTFNTLTVNKTSASGKVTLTNNISAATVNMTNGSLNTGANTLTITAERTGNGIILGTIQRTHAFTTGVAYAFEGPDNTITFTSVSGVSSITVNVTKGIVTGFPYEGSINRLYDIVIPSGTYTATLRLHYEDNELNGNGDGTMKLWQFNSPTWSAAGQTGSSSTANYMELSGLTSIGTKWTLSDDANVVAWNGSASSNWFDASNWTSIEGSPSRPPSAKDIVALGTASFNYQPSINNNAYAESILFGSVQPVTLTLTTGGTLTSGNITGVWSNDATHTINVSNQTVTVNGDLQMSKGTAGQAINLNIGTGTVNVSADLVQSGGANIAFTGAGTINIGDDFDYTSGTFTAGAGTVVFNGTQEQIAAGVTYNNLIINKTAGIALLNNSATILRNLSVEAGELDINAASSISGNVTLAPGATLSNNGIILTVGGNWNNGGNYISSNGSIIFNGSGAQGISPTTFNNLTVNKTSGTATFTGNCAINGDISVLAGALDIGTFTANRSSSGGILSVNNGASLLVAGADFPANFSTYSFGNTSTINYNGTIAQNISGFTYGNLVLSNGSANVKTLTASAIINGDITINSGAALNANTYTISLSGNWTNNGTFTPSTSTVILNGTAKTITGITTFNNLTANGTYTAPNSNLTFNGDLLNYGTLTYSGTITLSGTIAQTLVLNSLIPSANSVFNFNGTVSPVFNSTVSTDFITVNINNTAGVTAVSDWNVLAAFTVGSGATFNGGSLIQNFRGSFTNNGTVTTSGSLNYTPSTAQTIQLRGTNFTSSGSIVFGGTGPITITGSPTSLNDITISNTAGVSPSAGWTIGNDFTISSGAIFNAGSYNFSVAGDIQSNGTLNGGTSTFTMSSAAGQISGSPATTFNNFTATGTTITVNDNFNVSGNLTTTGTLDATGGTVIFTGSGNSTISGATTSLAQFSIAKNTGALVTLARNVTAVSRLDIISGTLDASTYSITQDATAGAVNNLFIRNNAAFKIGGTNALPSFTTYAFDSLSTVDYAGTTQTITSISSKSPYGNLTISSAGTKTANGSLNIRNNFTLTNGTFVAGSYIDTLGGNWSMTSGAFTNTGSTITLNGTRTQDINSTGAFNNLSINKTTASATLSSDISVNGALTFTLGSVATGTNKVIIPSGGSVSGAGQSAGWVNGNLQKYFSATAGGTFEVGGPLYYSPVSATFASVTTPGSLIAGATQSYHPNITASGIQQNRSIKRYWTLSKPATGAITFTTATLSFTWNPTDNYSPITASSEKVALYNGSTWTFPTLTGTPTTTNIQATGVSSTGDFAVGETCNVTTGFSYSSSAYCANGGTANIALNSGATAGTFSASPSGLTLNTSTGAVTLSSSTPGTYTVTNTATGTGGCVSSSFATITITAAPSATISYAGSPYCSNAGTASVTLTGTTGGSYSSTTGLSINTTTGAVNLSASTPGSYTVTYSVGASGGCATYSTTAPIAITAAPSATISYAGSPYCSNAGTASVTITGTTGGSYSSTTGLSINTTTGAVILSASTPGSYTVTYTVAASGGCATYTTTAPIAITAAPSATISYAGSPYCSNAGTASVTITGTTGGSYSSTTGLSINTTTGAVNLSASTPGSYTVTYSVAASGGCAAYATTAGITINAAGTWIGGVNNDWNNAGNWSCGVLPASGTDVTIRSSSSAFPAINSGTIAVRNLTIMTGASFTLSNATVQISGTVTNNGTFTATNGTIEMNGTSAQTIAANTFTNNAIKDLIITNPAGVGLAGALNITNAISFGNINNSVFTSNGFLTLISNDAGTARVADITNGGTNTGNNVSGMVTVQRFNTAKRATRFLTSPVNSQGSIRANWMENTNNPSTSVNNNPVPGFGTHITGSGGSTNGFDPTYTNNPSLYTYNNVTQAWAPATSTASPLMAGHGYRIVVRGSRSTNLNSNDAPPSPTTLRATGTLVTGTVSMKKPGGGGTANMPEFSAATNGYSFIGNPYASPVDWLTLERTDLTSSIYIFDATIQGANGRGAYVSYNASTRSNSNASSQVDNNIQSGQAFFVQSAGPNPSLTFKEQYKTGINRRVFRLVKDMPHLSLQLLLPRQENTGASADGLAAYFSNDFDTAVGNEDSYKLANQDENIAIVRNGKTLSIEGRKPVISTDTLPLKIWNITLKNYIIKIDLSGFDTNLESFLEDSYLHTSTKLDNNAQTFVRFSLTGDSASFATDRFRIVFKNSVVLSAQPGIKAYQKNKGVEVEKCKQVLDLD